jgi:predicted RND superfamily exporter protein
MRPSRFLEGGVLVLLILSAVPARANQESEDLRRQIESQRAAVSDLERLDERHQVTDEITLLRSWLDEAWSQYSKEEYKKVREVVDRCLAQAELIRQRITAAKMTAYANDREQAVRTTRDKLQRTRQALLEAQATKKAMEMNK